MTNKIISLAIIEDKTLQKRARYHVIFNYHTEDGILDQQYYTTDYVDWFMAKQFVQDWIMGYIGTGEGYVNTKMYFTSASTKKTYYKGPYTAVLLIQSNTPTQRFVKVVEITKDKITAEEKVISTNETRGQTSDAFKIGVVRTFNLLKEDAIL